MRFAALFLAAFTLLATPVVHLTCVSLCGAPRMATTTGGCHDRPTGSGTTMTSTSHQCDEPLLTVRTTIAPQLRLSPGLALLSHLSPESWQHAHHALSSIPAAHVPPDVPISALPILRL